MENKKIDLDTFIEGFCNRNCPFNFDNNNNPKKDKFGLYPSDYCILCIEMLGKVYVKRYKPTKARLKQSLKSYRNN